MYVGCLTRVLIRGIAVTISIERNYCGWNHLELFIIPSFCINCYNYMYSIHNRFPLSINSDMQHCTQISFKPSPHIIPQKTFLTPYCAISHYLLASFILSSLQNSRIVFFIECKTTDYTTAQRSWVQRSHKSLETLDLLLSWCVRLPYLCYTAAANITNLFITLQYELV